MTGVTGLFVARDGDDDGTVPVGGRKALGGLIQWEGPNPLDTADGVFADSMTPVVAGTAGMSYDVRAFVATGRQSAAIGPWIAANDATLNVATTAAPGANSRIDVIWCRQHFVADDSGADSDVDFEIGVTQGTASASPAVPSIPTGALALAKVTVPTGTTATNALTFTRLHEWVSARGAVTPSIAYTPTVGGVTTGALDCRYVRFGDFITVEFYLRFSAAPTASVYVTGPVATTALPPNNSKGVGQAILRNVGTGNEYGVVVTQYTDGKFYFLFTDGNNNYVDSSETTFILNSELSGTFTYRVA